MQSNGAIAVDVLDSDVSGNETPHKIHIRGVDDLTTNDIKAFSIEHFPSGQPVRVEWIDDTSANLVYSSPGDGFKALDQLSLDFSPTVRSIDLRPAKTLSTHPKSVLYIRAALTSDQKKPRAHEASRFYMMHPEHDPREARRRNHSQNSNADYRRRRYGDDENRRRRRRDKEDGFDASMYDDDKHQSSSERSPTSSGRRSHRALDSYRPRHNGADGSRDRSASPERLNGDGRRRRKRTPPPAYQSKDPHPTPTENGGKELFPIKSKQSNGIGKDLFSNKILASELKKELFPQKTNIISHRRSDAFDAADETADLFAHRMSVPFADEDKRSAVKSLASRITAPAESTYGRLKGSDSEPRMEIVDRDDDIGLNIRGASQDQGFSIRGSAAGTIKELFPGKGTGNTGKELFAERLEGRGSRRTRAEDMFY